MVNIILNKQHAIKLIHDKFNCRRMMLLLVVIKSFKIKFFSTSWGSFPYKNKKKKKVFFFFFFFFWKLKKKKK
jgi:hypothetical protein